MARVSALVSGVGTISRSFITLAGLKKWRPMKRPGFGSALGDGAGVEVGGVGREDRVRAAGGAELGEDGALDGEVLEHGLDDEIGVGEGGIVGGGGDAGHAVGGVGLGQAAALDGAVEDAAEVGEAAGQRLVVALDQRDGDAGVAQRGGDAGAHRAAADDGGGADGLRLDALQRGGRGAARSAKKTWRRAAASGEARRARKVSRSKAIAASKSASVARRRQASARSGAASPRAAFLTAFSASSQKPGAAASGARRGAERGAAQVGGEGDGAGAEVAVDDAVDQAELERLRRLYRLAGGDDVDGGGGRDEARQADGAAGPGDEAERDLGQAHGGRGHGDAKAAGQRHLETAAQGRAVDRRGPGLSAASIRATRSGR